MGQDRSDEGIRRSRPSNNGHLDNCTEKACLERCPSGTTAGTRCAQCGPAGGCTPLETGCFGTCGDATDRGPGQLCFDGACAMACL